jgi:uncharacterized cupredoxin-like copper-binding protein
MSIFKVKHLFLLLLLMVLALGLSACSTASAANQAVEVKITLDSFKIEATMTKFKVGVPYRFVITNQGQVAHEFRIMPPSVGVATSDQIQAAALASISAAKLAPGQTHSLEYTFQQPTALGELEFSCHMPGHYDAGMHIPIIVEK